MWIVRSPLVILLVGLFLAIVLPANSLADVYNCSKGFRIIYKETPCAGGVNLNSDAQIQEMIAVSGKKSFFSSLDPVPVYRPVREGEVDEQEAIRFFKRVSEACIAKNFNDFYSTFSYQFRRAISAISPEELADRMRLYCQGDYTPDRLQPVLSSGEFRVLESRSTEQGMKKGILCWSDIEHGQCKISIDMALEGGELVRDEF